MRVPAQAPEAVGAAQMAASGVVVPSDHRPEWAETWGTHGRVIEVWAESRCECTLVVEVGESRALPGHDLWRVDRLGGYADPVGMEAAIEALTIIAQRDRRVLSVSVGLTADDSSVRERLATRARALGYRRAPSERNYAQTFKIDLRQSPESMMSAMRPSCRRGIRAVSKHDIEIGPVDDPALGPKLSGLYAETMARTEGVGQGRPWSRVIHYVRAHPDAARLVGTYSSRGERRLLAFALGLRQGDHVEYRTAASSRDGQGTPVGYALAWDLILWAQEAGASWFDFGGLPKPPIPEELAGIVRFKKSFGGEAILFREEWILELRPFLGSFRRGLSAGAGLLKRLGRGD